MKRRRIAAVVRVELKSLFRSTDYWLPMVLMAALFFVIIPGLLLLMVDRAQGNRLVNELSDLIGSLPSAVQENVQGDTERAQSSFVLAVYLLAPVAIVVPLTISSAVGANTIVGERERGTGEFLAHSPLGEDDIYIGKLIASLIPGFLATAVGFGLYSLIVNLIVGPQVGGWFFPTAGWWLLILWVVPPFIAVALSVILRLSARVKSAAAAQQAATLVALPTILASYFISSGLFYDPTIAAIFVGALAWLLAGVGIFRGRRAIKRDRLLGVASD
jgi:ABC-type Na+ efflux pump permease subunit